MQLCALVTSGDSCLRSGIGPIEVILGTGEVPERAREVRLPIQTITDSQTHK